LKENVEVTTGLFTEGICMTNMKSLTTLQPSNIFIETLEDAIVVKLSKDSMIQLYKEAPQLEGVGRVILEHMLAEDAEWKEIYTIYNPQERYRFLVNKAPQLLQKIPLQHIASFLGMRRETLSRIRSRAAKKSF
jgi:CRP-like cAMP-binding protein